MSRKRNVDHESSISGALGLFWRRGYTGASTRELEDQTGLTRFTLQTTYGGKKNFFLETLDAYLDNAEAKHLPDAASYSIDDLASWFEAIVSAEKMPEIEDAGCLAFNSISQFDRSDPEVNVRIERYLDGLESRFADILQRAESTGKAQLPQSPTATAKILLGMLLGLHSIMKARTTNNFPIDYANAAADLIRSWKVADETK